METPNAVKAGAESVSLTKIKKAAGRALELRQRNKFAVRSGALRGLHGNEEDSCF